MKKFVSLFFAFVLCTLALVSCDKNPNISQDNLNDNNILSDSQNGTDVWDGSVAPSFEDGEGTESNPYQLATGSQLAYLAQQVNLGISYSEKYFVLCNDIDLNDIEWTPI